MSMFTRFSGTGLRTCVVPAALRRFATVSDKQNMRKAPWDQLPLPDLIPHRAVDNIFGTLARGNGSFFSRGWGNLEDVWLSQDTSEMDWVHAMFTRSRATRPERSPALLHLVWHRVECAPGQHHTLLEAEFPSPVPEPYASELPPESRTSYVRLLLPRDHDPQRPTPCVLHLPGTGDHGFSRRQKFVQPLLDKGIANMLLEGPYYGRRRPVEQAGAKLHRVADLLTMGRTAIEEASCLLHWLQQEGFGPLGVCGISMGGVHAAMVGALHRTPTAVIPLLTPHSAVAPFCEGQLRHSVQWASLQAAPCPRLDLLATPRPPSLATPPASPLPIPDNAADDPVQGKLRHVLDMFTNITRLPQPASSHAAVVVAATNDAYVPPGSALTVQQWLTGSEMRWVKGGHVSSFLLHQNVFRQAITDALSKLEHAAPLSNALTHLHNAKEKAKTRFDDCSKVVGT